MLVFVILWSRVDLVDRIFTLQFLSLSVLIVLGLT